MSSHGEHGGGGGGMPPPAHEEGHEGAPEWLISFADNTALIMGFFVILLAMNMGPKGASGGAPSEVEGTGGPPIEMTDVALAIREAFNNPVSMNSMDPNDLPLVRRLLERRGKAQTEDDGPRGDQHNVQSLRRSHYFSPCGQVLFEHGQSQMDEAARASLDEIAKHVRGVRLMVDVRGHVSAAEAFESDDHGVRLSFARAMAVGSRLAELGIDWKQIRLQACANNEPVAAPVYDRDGHKPNQRVEIVVTNEIPAASESPEEGEG